MDKNSKFINEKVRELRKKSTPAEKLFISKLLYNRIKFTFQYPISYGKTFIICDFYIPKYNLIVEIDGKYHDEILQVLKDSERNKYLINYGFNLLRIDNENVDTFDTLSIKNFLVEPIKKTAIKSNYTLAQKVEDKKKMTPKMFKLKYG